jgi:hypothetical protein
MKYLPDPKYNPIYAKELTTQTVLQKGITIGNFLVNTGLPIDYDNIVSYTRKLTIAKNLYLQGEFLRVARKYGKFRVIVSEGLYKPAPREVVTSNGINDYRQTGRAIVYEIYDQYGDLAVNSTFDMVNYLRTASRYDKLILAYDTFTGNSLHASIIAVMPTISDSWDVTFRYNLETQFNNKVQSSNEIIEIRL